MQYEERVTRGGITCRQDGVIISQSRRPARPQPVLSPVHGATRAAGPFAAGHEPLSIIHVHAHPDGHGGTHSHLHPHTGDNNHSGAGHPAAPGNPDADMTGAQLNSSGTGGETRDVYAKAVRYLELEGVDVARGLQRAEDAQDAATSRTRAAVHDIRGLALTLKRAETDLLAESRGFNEGGTGFTSARLGEARERVDRLTAELRAACLDDPALARAARRAAG